MGGDGILFGLRARNTVSSPQLSHSYMIGKRAGRRWRGRKVTKRARTRSIFGASETLRRGERKEKEKEERVNITASSG